MPWAPLWQQKAVTAVYRECQMTSACALGAGLPCARATGTIITRAKQKVPWATERAHFLPQIREPEECKSEHRPIPDSDTEQYHSCRQRTGGAHGRHAVEGLALVPRD